MLEEHLDSAITRRRLRSGPAADHIDAFADWLHLGGYTPISITCLLRSLSGWTDWMLGAGFSAQDLVQGFESCKLHVLEKKRRKHERGPNQQSIAAASVFIRFLQQEGVLAMPLVAPSASDLYPILREFRSWMREHRGLAESTLDVYERTIVDLLKFLGDDPHSYTASTLRGFVLERARPHGIWSAKSIVVATRSFLRFLSITGRCSPGLEQGIPGFASYQLSSIPRFLVSADVERLIESCEEDMLGIRDRAVLLLLARLGLRASEVANLKFSDIDWHNGTISMCGKGRRQELLPLPQEVGDAILHYLKKGRPFLRVPEVFTSVWAPIRPITRAGVTHIVRSALRRTGIKTPINGAHVLRHSAATSMLSKGATLASIGAVLRHRSPSTTAHYAKVDFDQLSQIAQPWPEVHHVN